MRCLTVSNGAFGGLLLLIAAALFVREQIFLQNAERTTGTVTSLDRQLSGDGHVYCPVIQFKTADGEVSSFTEEVCSDPASFAVGDTQELYYDPRNPKRVQMDNFWAKYTAEFALSAIGLPFLLFALYSSIVDRKPKNTPKPGVGGQRPPNRMG